MGENDNIERKIKESFEGIRKSAPGDLWSKLSGELSSADPLDSKVKSAFENRAAQAPDFVWSKINTQLNIDRVWKRLSHSLDRKPVFYWRRIAGITALILLLLGGIGYWYVSPVEIPLNINDKPNEALTEKSSSNDGTSGSEKVTLPGNANEHSSSVKNVTAFENVHGETPVQITVEDRSKSQKSSSSSASMAMTISKSSSSNETLPAEELKNTLVSADSSSGYIPPKNILLMAASPATGDIAMQLSAIDTALMKPSLKKRNMELGLTYAFNNTWILDNTTFKGLDKTSTTQISPAYAASYGIVGNYNFTAKHALSAELYINARYKQKYSDYREGHYFNMLNEFNYSKLTFLYQRNFEQVRVIPSKYTLKAGMYTMYLRNHIHNVNGKTGETEIDDYKHIDYGLKLFIGQEKSFSNFIFGYGLNGEYGFANIFSGNRHMSSGFNHTRNALVGASLSVKRRF